MLRSLVHLQKEQDLAEAMKSAVATFEAESDAFFAAHNLDKLSLEDTEMNRELAVCNASLADSQANIRLHTEQAKNLRLQTTQLAKAIEEAAEYLKGKRPVTLEIISPSSSAGAVL